MPQRGERLVPSRRRAGKLSDIFAGKTGRDLPQLKVAIVTPGKEAAGDAAIGPAGVFVVESSLEKFLGGEGCVGSLTQDVTAAAGSGNDAGAPAGGPVLGTLPSRPFTRR
jgi:hypothetical protein